MMKRIAGIFARAATFQIEGWPEFVAFIVLAWVLVQCFYFAGILK